MNPTRIEDKVLKQILTVVCGWEFVALTTRRIPTVSAVVWRLLEDVAEDAPPSTRRRAQRRRQGLIALWIAVVAHLSAHFFRR